MTGTCKFCNQTMIVADVDNQKDADEYASRNCNCKEGREYRSIEDMKECAWENAQSLFTLPDGVPEEAFKKHQEKMSLVHKMIEYVASGAITKCSVKINDWTTAVISINKNGEVDTIKKISQNLKLTATRY